jgi:hypothetical protein
MSRGTHAAGDSLLRRRSKRAQVSRFRAGEEAFPALRLSAINEELDHRLTQMSVYSPATRGPLHVETERASRVHIMGQLGEDQADLARES